MKAKYIVENVPRNVTGKIKVGETCFKSTTVSNLNISMSNLKPCSYFI